MKTLIIVLILAALIAFIALQTSEVNRKCESRKRYSALWDFYHFVGTCKVNDSTRAYISDRIKSERSLNVDEKALHIVDMCEEIFDARFNRIKK
jgi:hypothetical protein